MKRPPRILLPYLASLRHQGRFDKKAGKKASKTDPGTGSKSLRKRLIRWNRLPDEKRPISVAVQREMREHFKEEIDRLGSLIGRDLSHWLQPRQ